METKSETNGSPGIRDSAGSDAYYGPATSFKAKTTRKEPPSKEPFINGPSRKKISAKKHLRMRYCRARYHRMKQPSTKPLTLKSLVKELAWFQLWLASHRNTHDSKKGNGWLQCLYGFFRSILLDALSTGLRPILTALFTFTIISFSFVMLALVVNKLAIPILFTLLKGAFSGDSPTFGLSTFDPLHFSCQVPLAKNWEHCKVSRNATTCTKQDPKGYVQVYTNGLRKVGQKFDDVQDIATKSNGLAGQLSQEIDHMAVIRRIVQQSNLPEAESIIEAADLLEADATATVSMLRDFLPEARNCGHFFRLHLIQHLEKGMENIARDRNRHGSWIRALGFGHSEAREIYDTVLDLFKLLDSTMGRIELLRQGSEDLLTSMGKVQADIRRLEETAVDNRKRINQNMLDKKQAILGGFRHRDDIVLLNERLRYVDELDGLIIQGGQAVRALHGAIENIKSELQLMKREASFHQTKAISLEAFVDGLQQGMDKLDEYLDSVRTLPSSRVLTATTIDPSPEATNC